MSYFIHFCPEADEVAAGSAKPEAAAGSGSAQKRPPEEDEDSKATIAKLQKRIAELEETGPGRAIVAHTEAAAVALSKVENIMVAQGGPSGHVFEGALAAIASAKMSIGKALAVSSAATMAFQENASALDTASKAVRAAYDKYIKDQMNQ